MPEVSLIQLILLMVSTWLLEHIKYRNKHIRKRTVCQVGYLQELFTRIGNQKFDKESLSLSCKM